MKKLLLIALLLPMGVVSCIQKESYTYTEQRCIDGYYEEYWTGGKMVSKPTMDANRLEKRWVCTETITDTLIGYTFVLKR